MSLAVSIAVVLAAYLMGGCMPGYWFVRWRTGRDVREQGSGGTGATNAGRALGRSGFFVVMVLDGLKGAVADNDDLRGFVEQIGIGFADIEAAKCVCRAKCYGQRAKSQKFFHRTPPR